MLPTTLAEVPYWLVGVSFATLMAWGFAYGLGRGAAYWENERRTRAEAGTKVTPMRQRRAPRRASAMDFGGASTREEQMRLLALIEAAEGHNADQDS